MRKKTILLLGAAMTVAAQTVSLKPRLVVCTDIAPADVEPDDMESMVRLMAYADMFEIEALITSVGWNCDPYPAEWAEYLHRVITAYGKDVRNLMKRSGQQSFLPLDQETSLLPFSIFRQMPAGVLSTSSARVTTSRGMEGSLWCLTGESSFTANNKHGGEPIGPPPCMIFTIFGKAYRSMLHVACSVSLIEASLLEGTCMRNQLVQLLIISLVS